MNVPIPISDIPALITLFGTSVHAGFPSPAADYVQKVIDLNAMFIKNKAATYLFKVDGESMRDVGIYTGDYLIVDKSIEPVHNRIVLAIVDDLFTVKRLYKRGGVVRLMPENPAFKPIDFHEGQEMCIWGVATFSVHSLLCL